MRHVATSLSLALALFGLLLVPAGCQKKKPKGSEYWSLEDANVRYDTPAGWSVLDPPASWNAVESGGRRTGLGLIHVQENLALAVFFPSDAITLYVAVQGPERPYDGTSADPLSHRAETRWQESWFDEGLPMATDRVADTVALADGTTLSLFQARMRPGLLAGEDVVQAIAFGRVKGRYVTIAAGAYTEALDDPDEVRTAVAEIAKTIEVEGSSAPSHLELE